MTTYESILPVVQGVYSPGGFRPGSTVDAMAKEIARRLDARAWDSRGREHMVMMICWDWMTGGGTAEIAAKRILAALDARVADDHARDMEHYFDGLDEV